ncbi:MAG: radical SAM protein [Planctomycetes bacterium]|nr:radical SAM protein [Planctomycetota bacterium]
MQCVFCQNHQISRNDRPVVDHEMELEDVLAQVENILDKSINAVGFVSPSHCIPQMKVIIRALESKGRNPVYVFNTNAYDKKETIESLDGIIDVYLPDLKYMDDDLACLYSGTPDYPIIAAISIKEMFRQKGSNIVLRDDGVIESGLIIRHLVLPGQIENSKQCLRFIAEQLSTTVHISLMSQYYPTAGVSGHSELGRSLTQEEYNEVIEEFHRLGFYRGWVQELESQVCYRPDFERANVFE